MLATEKTSKYCVNCAEAFHNKLLLYSYCLPAGALWTTLVAFHPSDNAGFPIQVTTLQAADGDHQYWSMAPSKWCSCSLRRLSSANRQVATLSKFQQLSRAKTQAGPLLFSSRWYIVSPPALPTRRIIVKYLEYRHWCQRLPVTNQQLFDLTVLPGPQQVQARGLLHRCQCHPFRSCRRVSHDIRSLDARGWRMVSMIAVQTWQF